MVERSEVGDTGYLVLFALVSLDKGFGREIRDAVETVFDVRLPSASLYTTIERLTRLGLIELVDIVPNEQGAPRKVYSLRSEGRRVALQEADRLRETVRSLPAGLSGSPA